MTIKVNYPSEPDAIELLKENISEFKATLIIESIEHLNVSDDSKKEILKNLLGALG